MKPIVGLISVFVVIIGFLAALYVVVMFVAFVLFSDEQGRPFGIDVAKYDDAVFWLDGPTTT